MSLVVVGLTVFLVPLVLLVAAGDFRGETLNRVAGYTGWVLALEAVMIGVFATCDALLFYVLFGPVVLPMYFLIGRCNEEGTLRTTIKFILYSFFGGLVILVGVVVPATRTEGSEGLFLGSAAQAAGSNGMSVFFTFLAAFVIKVSMFLVHAWFPDTAKKAPAGAFTLLVGVPDKIGAYGTIVLCLPIASDAAKSVVAPVMVLTVISVFWGAFMTIISNDLVCLIAYISVNHFGFIVFGVSSGSSTTMTGTIVYMAAHGITTGALLLTVGPLRHRGGDAFITMYGGWQYVTSVIAGIFLVSGLTAVVLPGLSGFAPKCPVLIGTFEVRRASVLVAVPVVILATAYILLPYQRIFTGPKSDVAVPDFDMREKTVAGIPVAAILALGFLPLPPIDTVRSAAIQPPVVAIEGSAK